MTRDELKAELGALLKEAKNIFYDEIIAELPEQAKKLKLEKSKMAHISTPQRYQNWFSKILPLLRQSAPDRLEEFTDQYRPDPRRKNLTSLNYTLQDYFRGFRGRDFSAVNMFSSQFQHQITIVEAVLETFDQRLANIEAVVQSDLFKHELEAADEFVSKGHRRAAGALAGVTLEAHLRKVCNDRSIKLTKKSPTISDYNDVLERDEFRLNRFGIPKSGDF